MSERFTAQELAMLANPAYIGSHQPWVGELDLVNVVRCRDCKHAEPDDSGRSYYEGMLWCSELGGDDSLPVEPDGFCAWGERR